jgi:hypothetical protein
MQMLDDMNTLFIMDILNSQSTIWFDLRMSSVVENLWAAGTWWTRLEANNFALRAKSWISKLGLLLTLLRKLSRIAPLRAHRFSTTDCISDFIVIS